MTARPVVAPVDLDAVPAELLDTPRWIGWRYELRESRDGPRWTKVPIGSGGYEVSVTDNRNYGTVAEALAWQRLYDLSGIGFCLGDGWAGVDFDHVLNSETGEIAQWARDYIGLLDSYTEVSPSGEGAKVFLRGVLPPGRRRKKMEGGAAEIEMYDSGRFFTVTGHHLPGTSRDVRERSVQLRALHAEAFPRREPRASANGQKRAPLNLADEEVIDKAMAAKNGPAFSRRWNGQWQGWYTSQSEADLALANDLAFWTGGDAAQMDRLFRRSGLMRDKWDEVHYSSGQTIGQHTIALALEGRGPDDFFNPRRPTTNTDGMNNSGTSGPDDGHPVRPAWQPSVLITAQEREQAARGTWVDDYVAYAAKRTDAPWNFHEALAFTALSVVVGRRAVLRLSTGDVYPALWIIIVADSSLYRKSTAMDLMRAPVEALDRDLLSPNDFTPQRFVAILAEHDGRPLLFVRDEFSGFYDALNRLDFMAGLKETLLNVYDGRPFHREKMKPKKSRDGGEPPEEEWRFDVREPFLSIAVATTEERFSDVARVNDLHSGFLPRFGFELPPEEPSARKPISELTQEMEQEGTKLLDRLRHIREAPIHLACAQDVFERFDRYVADLEAEAGQAPDRNLVAIVGARVSWMGLRVAMLLAVADGTQRVGLPHLLRGIELAERWRHNALRVLGGLAPSKFERSAARVVQLVGRKETGMSRRDVMRALKINRRDMDELQSTLEERGELMVERHMTSGGVSVWFSVPKVVTGVTGVTGAFSQGNEPNAENPLGANGDMGDNAETLGGQDWEEVVP